MPLLFLVVGDSINQSVSFTGDVLRFAVVVVGGRTLSVLTTRHVMSSDPPLVTVAHPDTALRQMSALSAWGHQLLRSTV